MKGKNNGILIPVGNEEKLLEAMNLIADDKTIAENFSKEAVKLKEEFSINKVGKMWSNLCE